MENRLMIFEGHKVEILEFEGKVLFNPYHVGTCLEIGENGIKTAISKMNEKQVVKLTNSKVAKYNFRKLHNTGENFLTESGVYKLVFKSHKPNAEEFTDWIADEVLPSIRRHGGYIVGQETLSDDELMAKALMVAQKKIAEKDRLIKEKDKRINEMHSKEVFADAVSSSYSSMLVRDVAKMIRQNGVPLGEKRFYKWLRENGYICKNGTAPTQKAMEMGLFEIVVRTIEREGSLPIETKTTKVTGKGQQYFINKFLA